ncbi:MAG: preprotein translocase subunit SecA, partial [Verrucomicrobiia bacterium]
MVSWILKKFLGSKNQREVKRLWPMVHRVNEIEAEYQKLTDEQLRAKTDEFRKRLAEGATLDDLLPEAFAAVKNACRRLLGKEWPVRGQPYKWDMVPFDVQVLGGIALHNGRIAEMATGEGKTLVATMPLYLNALAGNAHLVTVNDYLAARDAEWVGEVHKFLGLTIGCIQHDQSPAVRRAQYACDITYGTNAEFGFDYLRDNGMATSLETQVQRGHFYAIVDEVDSILIDEARTPLIISGPSTVSTHAYDKYKPQVAELVRAQTMFCNRLVSDAKQLLDGRTDAGKTNDDLNRRAQAGRLLYEVKLGMPKNKQLQKMMEEPEIRQLVDQAELEVLKDSTKKDMLALKEELFFSIDEKQHDADLTEKGRKYLNPNDPDAFVIPDLVMALQEVDGRQVPDAEREKEKQRIQQAFDERSEKIHNIAQLLRAYCLFERDVEYVVQENKVMIVDEFTGRLMPGRNWSDGLHQAVEAKEGVRVKEEYQTLATITLQNFFKLYKKICGMTGTAMTEANEFWKVYNLDVIAMPTNRKMQRINHPDVIYRTEREKYEAIANEIERMNKWDVVIPEKGDELLGEILRETDEAIEFQDRETRQKQTLPLSQIQAVEHSGRPILVGTVSIERSEMISHMLQQRGVQHQVLNAKHHQREAEIVAQAGRKGAVTIATNMAGRGTDIVLGGNPEAMAWSQLQTKYPTRLDVPPEEWDALVHEIEQREQMKAEGREVAALGGLHVLGSERHEARRIDLQLRGRCGRQGDAGSSRFYLSLEDDLMRKFGGEWVKNWLTRLGMQEGEAIESRMVSRRIEGAQKKVEERNFEARKNLLEYDEVMDEQRKRVYSFRQRLLDGTPPKDEILEMVDSQVR